MGRSRALAQSCAPSYPFTTPSEPRGGFTLAPTHEDGLRNAELVDQLPVIVFEADVQGRLRFVSAEWFRAAGEATDGVIGEPATALVRPEDAALMRAQLDAAIRSGHEQSSAIVGLAGPQPGRVHRLRVRPMRDADGTARGVVGLLADVTEHERRESVLRQGERLASLGTLLATAAHELNNPLAAISGFSQLLLGSSQSAETREALEMIHHEASRAARTVRDLLGFSRARQMEQRSPVDLNAIVAHVVASRRYALETHGIACESVLAPDLPPVLGERSQLEQLVLALVVNAEQVLTPLADGAPRGRSQPSLRLTLRTWATAGRAHLEVADTGPGIAPDDLPSIWDPFWTTKPEGEGTGLGLAIAHGIVESHAGTIEADSTEGQGSRFTVSLPACDRSLPDEASVAQSARPLDVLIVGRAATLDFLGRYLASRGHAVLTASTAKRALRVAAQVPVNVVICEVQKRDLPAIELARRLREAAAGARPRIIFAAQQRPTAAARERLSEAGAAAILTTPWEIEAVRRAVEG